MTSTLTLKPSREKSVLYRHPWIFSGAIARITGDPASGETVEIRSSTGEKLGMAAFSPQSKITARMWTFDPDEVVDEAFFDRRLNAALALRSAVIPAGETDAMRLVHAESDGLPGLVVDRYAGLVVIQCLSAGAEANRELFANLLGRMTGVEAIYERSDVEVRRLEGLPVREGAVRGAAPDGRIEIHENGLRFLVDPVGGQKTGFYLDQRRNRRRVLELAAGREALNCFCYTGAFSAYLLAGGAKSVLSIDSSADAIAAARENMALNGFADHPGADYLEADVFHALRLFRDQARSYDLIVLDPPKFAPTAAQAERAARGYKDINLLAFKLLRPGGLLVTFSCSGGINADLFEKIISGAALDAQVDAEVVEHLTQGPDHPVALAFPRARI